MSEPNFWDASGIDWKNYQRSYGEGSEWPSRVRVAELVGPNDSVLEFGVAGGIVYEALKNKYPDMHERYFGSDYSSEAVKACREMFPEASWGEWDVRNRYLADGTTLMQDNDTFDDVVILSHVLDHVDRWEDALRNSWAFVKPGGKMVVVLWMATYDNDREPSIQDKGMDAWRVQFSHEWLARWMRVNLGGTVSVEKLPGNVPGREHRVDTLFLILKHNE